ncbi:MAG: hypothetical protein U1D30_19610 [Planctomycetota bacterium]
MSNIRARINRLSKIVGVKRDPGFTPYIPRDVRLFAILLDLRRGKDTMKRRKPGNKPGHEVPQQILGRLTDIAADLNRFQADMLTNAERANRVITQCIAYGIVPEDFDPAYLWN